jgi:4-amino-4-deoxy-L-arabinose transferase-like glycosyltransferase
MYQRFNMTYANAFSQSTDLSTRIRRRHILLLALILLYAAGFRLLVLDRPFHYDAEAYGCFYGILARNYLQFDWTETHGMPVLTVGHIPKAPLVFYRDHPPVVPLLIVPLYALFGVGEWQTRLPTALATVAAVLVMYLLLNRFSTRRIALIAAALFAATPMVLYYGGLPEVVGTQLILFILLSLMAYLHFLRKPCAGTFVLLLAAFSLAGLTDWPAFIIVPVLLIHFLVTQPRRYWPWIFAFCLAASAIFAMLYVYIVLATNAPWGWMADPLRTRTAIDGTSPFTLTQWLATALKRNLARHTLPIILLASGWLIVYGWRLHRPPPGATVARLLLAWGILHVLIGRQGVYTHEWWWSPLTPGLVIAAALLLDSLVRLLEHSALSRAANPTAALLILLFALWTALRALIELGPLQRRGPFTTVELGQAIQAAAPNPNDIAMLVHGEADPQLWFYGNRPLRLDIWSIEDFQRRLEDDQVDLVYYFEQPWKAVPTGIVFPVDHRHERAELLAYLQQRYAQVRLAAHLANKFYVFDLRQSGR